MLKRMLAVGILTMLLILPGTTATTKRVRDVYEVGEYIPTVVGSKSGNAPLHYNGDTLSYTRTGRIVHVAGTIVTTGAYGDGYLRISLPYDVADLTKLSDDFISSCAITGMYGPAFDGPVYCSAHGGSNYIGMKLADYSYVKISDLNMFDEITINITYFTN